MSKSLTLRMTDQTISLMDDLAYRIGARRPAQGAPGRTELMLMALDALAREEAAQAPQLPTPQRGEWNGR